MPLSQIGVENEKFRIDSEYFSKELMAADKIVRTFQGGFVPLGEISEKFRKGIFDIKANSYVESGIPLIRISNIKNGMIDDSEMVFIDNETHLAENKTKVVRNDIVISKTAYPAAACVVKESNVSQDIIACSISKEWKDRTNGPLLSSFLNSKIGLAVMGRYFQGNVQRHLSLDDGKKIPIPCFSVHFKNEVTACWQSAHDIKKKSNSLLQQAEDTLTAALGLANWRPPEPLTYTRRASDVFNTDRLDAEFFKPQIDQIYQKLSEKFALKTLGEFGEVENGQTVPYEEGKNTIPIIRSGDLSDISDDTKFLRAPATADIFRLKKGDILVSSIGFGSIGKVQVFDKDGTYGTVSEVTVIRQEKLNPYYIAAFLRSRFGQAQIEHFITGATGQLHLYKRDVRKIFIPIIPENQQQKLETLSTQAAQLRDNSRALLTAARRAVELAIEQSEHAALEFLNSTFNSNHTQRSFTS